jgi:hypothetical protein
MSLGCDRPIAASFFFFPRIASSETADKPGFAPYNTRADYESSCACRILHTGFEYRLQSGLGRHPRVSGPALVWMPRLSAGPIEPRASLCFADRRLLRAVLAIPVR